MTTTTPQPVSDSKPQADELPAPPTIDKEDELADNLGQGRRGGIIEDELLLADNLGKSRRGGLAADDTEVV